MVAFQDNFPSIFSKMATNSTDQSCSSGSGDNSDLLVVSDFKHILQIFWRNIIVCCVFTSRDSLYQ